VAVAAEADATEVEPLAEVVTTPSSDD
jgi:hypothetical protein